MKENKPCFENNNKYLTIGNLVLVFGAGHFIGRICNISDKTDFTIETFEIENNKVIRKTYDCDIEGNLVIYPYDFNEFTQEIIYLQQQLKKLWVI